MTEPIRIDPLGDADAGKSADAAASIAQDIEEIEEMDEVKEEVKEEQVVTPEEADEIADLTEAEIMQILSRGLITEQLSRHQDDPTRRYVWVFNHDVKIMAFKSLGYRLETSPQDEEIHPTGDDQVRLGDVVLMSCTRERHELILRAKALRSKRRREKGEKYYKDQAAKSKRTGGPEIIDESIKHKG